MAHITNVRNQFTVYDYQAYDTTKVPLEGEIRFFDNIHSKINGIYSIKGDGASQVDALKFCEILIARSNVDFSLESLRISGNMVNVQNYATSNITVNIGTTGTPINKTISPGYSYILTFTGSSWIEKNELGFVPIGSIIAWHKDLTGVPSLPDNFLECDGSVVSDSDSPLDGQTLPDLNGDARFLRGSGTSGTIQADQLQGFRVGTSAGEFREFDQGVNTAGAALPLVFDSSVTTRSQEIITDGVNGTPRLGSETRPVNMSVVWIIRIK